MMADDADTDDQAAPRDRIITGQCGAVRYLWYVLLRRWGESGDMMSLSGH